MSTDHKLFAQKRDVQGKGASRRLRHEGLMPAVLYGGEGEPVSLTMIHKDVYHASENEWFYSSLLTLDVDGAEERVLLRDMQRHPYKQIIMHVDFQRVVAGQAITTSIPLHFINEEKSPAGKSSEILLTHELNEVAIECLPKDLPEYIEVDLGEMDLDDSIHLSDLTLPEGVVLTDLAQGHDLTVAIARKTGGGAAEEEESTDAAAEEGGAESEEG